MAPDGNAKAPQKENRSEEDSCDRPEGKRKQIEGVGIGTDVVCQRKDEGGRHGCHHSSPFLRKFEHSKRKKRSRYQQQSKHHLFVDAGTNKRYGPSQIAGRQH